MNDLPPIFLANEKSHFMEPGAIGFVPAWIILFMIILTFVMLNPKRFKQEIFLAVLVGSLMPVLDDLFAFVFGPPFAHHSFFHSLVGIGITWLIFRVLSGKILAKYALFGNLSHILFNYYFDRVTLFFPFSYQEFGLTQIIKIDTYWIKAISYPIVFAFFGLGVIKYFSQYKGSK